MNSKQPPVSSRRASRRTFLKTTAAVASLAGVPYFRSSAPLLAQDAKAESANDRPLVGFVGTGSRWNGVGPNAMKFGDCVAVCDVDSQHAQKAQQRVAQIQGREVDVFEDYRRVLDNKDIDVIVIVTPDHWHSKIAIEAMQAGKDVYCEKPLTLTIDEGKKIVHTVNETNRVFQVGTQQRSEMGLRFLTALALIRQGRIGDVTKVQCAIGGAPSSGPIPTTDPPPHLNWDLWLGQAPMTEYRATNENGKSKTRCHYEFRWWYEYSGGKLTDWGAHHVDIAQWAIGMDQSGPLSVEGTSEHPVPLVDGYPTDPTQYNTATKFQITCKFPNQVEMVIRNDTDNGILFEGTNGRFFVNRGRIAGAPVDELKDNPLPDHAISEVYKGKQPGDHMRNFFECIKTREQPISDVFSHHRALTTCHLANIAIRLDRPLQWDPETEQIIGDEEANAWQSRPQREGYEITV